MKYIAKDGRVFSNECECLEYEKKLDADISEKEKELEELRKLELEYRQAKKKYEDAREAYEMKYDEFSDVISDIMRRVFPML